MPSAADAIWEKKRSQLYVEDAPLERSAEDRARLRQQAEAMGHRHTLCSRFMGWCGSLMRTKALNTHRVYTAYSFRYLSPENKFRKIMIAIADSVLLDRLTLAVLLINAFMFFLRFQTGSSTASERAVYVQIELLCNAFFVVEITMKMIAYGLWAGRYSFFRSTWHIFDLVVTICSFVWLIPGAPGVFRVVRLLRTLKIVTTVKPIKVMVDCLLQALPMLVDVSIFFFFLMLLYGLIGVQFYGGLFTHRCVVSDTFQAAINDTAVLVDHDQLCSPKSVREGMFGHGCDPMFECLPNFQNPNYGFTGFDNVALAWLTFFQVVSLEGWVQIMYWAEDTTSRWHSLVFLFLVLVGALFAINLIVAVIYVKYRQIRQSEDDRLDGPNQEQLTFGNHEWRRVGAKKETLTAEQQKELKDAAKLRLSDIAVDDARLVIFRGRVRVRERLSAFQRNVACPIDRLMRSETYVLIANLIVVLNCFVQALNTSENPELLRTWVRISCIGFAVLYGIDTLLLLVAHGWHVLKDGFHVVSLISLTAAVVCQATVGWGLSFLCLRLFTLLRHMQTWKPFRRIMFSVKQSLRDLKAFLWLLSTFMFVCASVGIALFSEAKNLDEDDMPVRPDFSTMWMALLSVFVVTTGENWTYLLFNGMRYDVGLGTVYFVVVYVLGSYILMSLFLAILLGNFSSDLPDELLDEQERAAKLEGTFEEARALDYYKAAFDRRFGPYLARLRQETTLESDEDVVDATESISESAATRPASTTLSGSMQINVYSPSARRESNTVSAASSGRRYSWADLLDTPEYERAHRKESSLEETKKDSDKWATLRDIRQNMVEQEKAMKRQEQEAQIEEESRRRERVRYMQLNRGLRKNKGRRFGKKKQTVGKKFIGNSAERPRSYIASAKLMEALKKEDKALHKTQSPPGTAWCRLDSTSPLRIRLFKFAQSNAFNTLVNIFILASCGILAFDSVQLRESEWFPQNQFVSYLITYEQILFAFLFLVEILIKITAYGFLSTPKAFMAKFINIVDLLVLAVLIITLGLEAGGLLTFHVVQSIQSVRVIRLFRLTLMTNLSLVTQSVLFALPELVNVLMLGLLGMFVLGLLAVEFFQGTMSRCSLGPEFGLQTCVDIGGAWTNPDTGHFDHIGAAMLTIFEMASRERWINVMWSVVDGTPYGEPPNHGTGHETANFSSALFCVVVMLVCAFFLMSLLLGVVTDEYARIYDIVTGHQDITLVQSYWLEAQKMMLDHRPKPCKQPPQRLFRKWSLDEKIRLQAFTLVEHKWFDRVVLIGVTINLLSMCFWASGQSQQLEQMHRGITVAFTLLFFLEMGVKLTAYGRQYAMDKWNIFDGLVTVGGMLAYLVDLYVDRAGIAAMRALLILRLFKFVKSWKRLNKLINTLIFCLPAFWNVFLVLCIFLSVYAIVGMRMFGKVKPGEFLNGYATFRSFDRAVVTLFRMATGESWNGIMHDCMVRPPDCTQGVDCGSVVGSLLYFLSFMLLIPFMLLNVLVGVVLKGFADEDRRANQGERPVRIEHMKEFTTVWHKYTSGDLLPVTLLPQFMYDLEPPLGLKKAEIDSMAKVTLQPVASGLPELQRRSKLLAMLDFLRSLRLPERDSKVHALELAAALAYRAFKIRYPEAQLQAVPASNQLLRLVHGQLGRVYPGIAKPIPRNQSSVVQAYAAVRIQATFRTWRERQRFQAIQAFNRTVLVEEGAKQDILDKQNRQREERQRQAAEDKKRKKAQKAFRRRQEASGLVVQPDSGQRVIGHRPARRAGQQGGVELTNFEPMKDKSTGQTFKDIRIEQIRQRDEEKRRKEAERERALEAKRERDALMTAALRGD